MLNNNIEICNSCEKRFEISDGISIAEISFKGQLTKNKSFCSTDCVIEWLIKDDANQIFT